MAKGQTKGSAAPGLDPVAVATRCREVIRQRYRDHRACIETSFLLQQTALLLNAPLRIMVTSAIAMSPKLAAHVEAGGEMADSPRGQGFWAVGIGFPENENDFVGRSMPEINRYVGHVVCLSETEQGCYLFDASADQAHRPQHDLRIEGPVIAKYDPESDLAIKKLANGTVVRYEFHRDIKPPRPKSELSLRRLAVKVAAEFK